ncbi:MAG: Hsp70 family protein [Alphaproteobacteria bacterium]|nr:Hsp70 family protein [Alphaproteobacteria bacterium]
MTADISFGVDFGTTNTVVMQAKRNGIVSPLPLEKSGEMARGVHPSVLAFEPIEVNGRAQIDYETGHKAIELAAEYPDDVRYIQSFKNHVASTAFKHTNIFSKRFSFSDLMVSFFKNTDLLNAIESAEGEKEVILGRPVTFYGPFPDEALALARYQEAFDRLGLSKVRIALEPVGGAFSYFRELQQSVTVLIADFGGGTSDFLIVRFTHTPEAIQAAPVAHAGIGIAGDSFDYRIIQNVLLKHLGSDSLCLVNGKSLPVPRKYYTSFSKWHLLTSLRTPVSLRELDDIKRSSTEPNLIQNLIDVIEMNRGLACFQAVSKAKATLSSTESAELSIDLGRVDVKEIVTRTSFEEWISEDLAEISGTVESLLQQADMVPSQIDRVFMTGGSSLIPAVRKIFTDKFGADQVVSGDEFGSVAQGLALLGLDPDIDRWTESKAL